MYRNDLSAALKARYGTKVYKLSLSTGCSCPNRDGTIDTRGCIFCSAAGGGEFAQQVTGSLTEQLARAKDLLREGTMPLKAISDFCGFENPNSLRKFFKAQTGRTMSEWRSGNLSAS